MGRIRRDHEFLRVLASEVKARGLGNPGTDLSLVNALAGNLTVDSGMSVTHMVTLVLTFHGVSINSAPQWTLPVAVDTFGSYTYKGFSKGTVVFPVEPNDQSIVNQFLGISNDINSLTGKPLPSPQSVTVSVLNGTGTATQATDTSQALGRLGFQTVGVGTAAPVGTESETLVTYSQRTPTDEAAAQLVARSLSGSVILAYGSTTDGADVTVTTGTGFSVNATAPTSVTTTSPAKTAAGGAGGTTATTAPATTSAASGTATSAPTSNFTAPTHASNPLKQYDPRACPPGVKGNANGWGS